MSSHSDQVLITEALASFQSSPLKEAATHLLNVLGYRSERSLSGTDSSPESFLDLFGSGHSFDRSKALVSEWKSADLLFQLTDQELSRESSLFTDTSVNSGLLKSYVFISIELRGKDYARGKLSAITRQINRLFPMPVMVLFRHQGLLTIAVINRRLHKLDESKDVLGKVTLISDIDFARPHRGHLDILASLISSNLVHPQKKPITDFDTLHAAWERIFNIELLNERFYRELSNWYFWALPQVDFPADLEPDAEKRRATGLIRRLRQFFLRRGISLIKGTHPPEIQRGKPLNPRKLFLNVGSQTLNNPLSPSLSQLTDHDVASDLPIEENELPTDGQMRPSLSGGNPASDLLKEGGVILT